MTMSRELGTPKHIQRNEVQYPVLITACTCLLISQYSIGTYPIGLLGVHGPHLCCHGYQMTGPHQCTFPDLPTQCNTHVSLHAVKQSTRCGVYTNATGECTDVQFVSIVPTPPCLLVRSITPAPPPSMHLADGHSPHVRTCPTLMGSTAACSELFAVVQHCN